MDIQRVIGADIVMAFDECPPLALHAAVRQRFAGPDRTLAGPAASSGSTLPSRFTATTRACSPSCRAPPTPTCAVRAAEHIAGLNRAGNAIGGLSVGEPAELMYEMTALVNAILPADKPRYLMGVGTPANVLESIALGVDMMDCVLPSRNARHGILYTTQGILNITNAKWKADFSPLDPELGGYASTFYSKAYVRHLFHSSELLGPQIASVHNLTFFLWLVGEARTRIKAGTFRDWKDRMVKQLMVRL